MGKSIFTLILLTISLFVVVKIKNFINNNEPQPIPEVVLIEEVTPTPTASSTPIISTKVSLSLEEPFLINGTTITALVVTEDSRCPIDVQCIQAGTVRLNVLLATPSGTSTMEIEPLKTITTETLAITLDSVSPDPRASKIILPEEYNFTFNIVNK